MEKTKNSGTNIYVPTDLKERISENKATGQPYHGYIQDLMEEEE